MPVLYQLVVLLLITTVSSDNPDEPILKPTEGSGMESTVSVLLSPLTTTITTITSTSTVSTVVPTTTSRTSECLNDTSVMTITSFVVVIADLAIELIILVLMLLVLGLIIRLLWLYGKYGRPVVAAEEGRGNIVGGADGRPCLQAAKEDNSAVQKIDTASQTISARPNPVIGELGEVLRKRRTLCETSATSIGVKRSPEPQKGGVRSPDQEHRAGLTSPQEQREDKRLASSSVTELSVAVRSSALKREETNKRGREGKTAKQESSESSPAATPMTTTTTTTTTKTTTTAAAAAVQIKALGSASREHMEQGSRKPGVEGGETAAGPKTSKKEKRKFTFRTSAKGKRYKQKEMEDEVAEPPAQVEENPELVLLLKMTTLMKDEENEEEVTDL